MALTENARALDFSSRGPTKKSPYFSRPGAGARGMRQCGSRKGWEGLPKSSMFVKIPI